MHNGVQQIYIVNTNKLKQAAATWKFPCGCCFLLLDLDFFGFLGLVCCNKRKEENTMTSIAKDRFILQVSLQSELCVL